ncbi:hypothetical protein M8J76_008447 [Diaphorina citri]|nr:hypothetical protein M8J76_008447 [Diaphorina citri]
MPEPNSSSSLCCLKLSKKQKFIIFHLLDSILLLAVQLIQGSVLTYYIYTHNNEIQYLLHSLDIFCALVFITALYSSYKYLAFFIDNNEYPDKRYVASPKRLFSQFPTSKLGVLPLSYMSWVIYVIVLLLKIQIIFGSDLFVILNKKDSFTPQLLKMIIGLASLVFLLLVEAHNRLELNSERYNYVTSVCSKVGIEIFDSVSLLSVLLLGDQVPAPFEHIVCMLAGINFLLPTLSLYRLSLPDRLAAKLSEKFPLQVFHHLSRTFLIEIPFLTVRLFLWVTYKEEASMFMMKNVFNILVTLRTLHPELVQYLSRDDREGHELDAPYVPHFEAVPLKQNGDGVQIF